MVAKKSKNVNDDRKARGRFVDQPGQWVNKTPKSVMKKRSQGIASLANDMKKNRKK